MGKPSASAEPSRPRPAAAASATAVTAQPRRTLLVSTRIGLIFLAVTICLLLCSLTAQWMPLGKSEASLIWIAALAVSSVGGLVSMRSVRTLRTIEQELGRRTGTGRQFESVRPIIGRDPITEGWNQLLAEASGAAASESPTRARATLDQEVVTLARAMRGLPVAWVITDTEGKIRFLGSVTTGLLNLKEDQSYVGSDLPLLLGLRGEDDPDAAETLSELLGAVRMVHKRRKMTIADRTVHIRITRSRLAGRSGDGEGLAWVLTDITQQRIATEARDQFLMTATHELRTPLNNLQAYAEALQSEESLEVEAQKEFCNVIHSEANRLGRLVDQLLTVSQMEAGSMIANRHELELLPMLEYAGDQVRAQAEQKQMKLTLNLSAKLPTVFGDRDKLQAAIVNLVGNAVKYTPAGGEVVLRCAADERWIRIDVEDNGTGIPEEEQSKVFEKFYRGVATQQSNERGNGLGLAFAREIARLHGGDIELNSVIGEGSVFTLRLPIGGRSRSGV